MIVAAQIVLLMAANYGAFVLRFDGSVPDWANRAFLLGLPLVLIARGFLLQRLRLFGGLWRYAGIWDLRNLIVAMAVASGALIAIAPLLVPSYPRAIFIIDGVVGIVLLGGLRLVSRAYRERSPRRIGTRSVLIFGAGDAGAMVAREMRQNPAHLLVPVGFLDDDPLKRGRYVYGVPVLGSRNDLESVIHRIRPDEILIAAPSMPSGPLKSLLEDLKTFDLPLKTLPSFEAMLDRQGPLVSQARPVAIEDVLRRPAVSLDETVVLELIRGRKVLVTGAGGSIGSELCRQVLASGPATLIMLDRYENGLYEIDHSLAREASGAQRIAVIADVTDRQRIERVFADHRPEIVFHAAAHKHVPLMESNPAEAVKNNVAGTRIVAEAALTAKVDRFILISTDKAVNPSSVMGATKRVAERIIRMLAHRSSSTVFGVVRFGNVLGSNGSVVPLFLRQIASGGPVTVTHPDMRRFFMSIPEAVELVLHAAGMMRQGELYILEMGEQLKVADVAADLIRLSAEPGARQQIAIEYIGIRPGEKLYEELVADDEILERSAQKGISRVIRSVEERDDADVPAVVSRLEAAAATGHDYLMRDMIKLLVPTFQVPPMRLDLASIAARAERTEDMSGAEVPSGDARDLTQPTWQVPDATLLEPAPPTQPSAAA